MDGKGPLRINTLAEARETGNGLGQFAAVVKRVAANINSIITAMFEKVKGVMKLFNVSGLFDALKKSIAAAMEFSAGDRFVAQFGSMAKVFGEKILLLKDAVGRAVIPITAVLMESGGQILDFFRDVAEAVGSVTERLFGSMGENADASQKAAKGQDKLAKATAAAGRAAKGSLAAFDKLNVLEIKSQTGGGGGGGPKPEKPEPPQEDGAIMGFEALNEALRNLREALEPLTAMLFEGLRWGYDNVLVPLSLWVMNMALPEFLNAVAEAAGVLTRILELMKPSAGWLWENFLEPLAQWTGEIVITALQGIAAALNAVSLWIDDNKEKLLGLWTTVEPLLTAIRDFVFGILDSVKLFFEVWCEAFTESLTGVLDLWLGIISGSWALAWSGIQQVFETNKALLLTGLGLLWEGMKTGFLNALDVVKAIWTPVGSWFQKTVLEPLNKNFGWLWDGIMTACDVAYQMVRGVWGQLSGWFAQNVIDPVAGEVERLWNDITGFFDSGLDYVSQSMKGYINLCMDMVEAAANLFIGVFNGIIDGLNTIQVEIPKWVPKYGGNSFGINIPNIPPVSLPRLASGAVIPPNAEFAAVLGDQRNGYNLEAPEGLLREIVREESGSREIVIRFEGSMAQLVRLLKPALEQEQSRQGARLISGGI